MDLIKRLLFVVINETEEELHKQYDKRETFKAELVDGTLNVDVSFYDRLKMSDRRCNLSCNTNAINLESDEPYSVIVGHRNELDMNEFVQVNEHIKMYAKKIDTFRIMNIVKLGSYSLLFNSDKLVKKDQGKNVVIDKDKMFVTMVGDGSLICLVSPILNSKDFAILYYTNNIADPKIQSIVDDFKKYGKDPNCRCLRTKNIDHYIINNKSKTYPVKITSKFVLEESFDEIREMLKNK